MMKLFDGFICFECGSSEPGRRHQFTPHPPLKARRDPWHLDTSPERQRRRALKRWHGHGDDGTLEDYQDRNARIVLLVGHGARQVTVAGVFGISQGRVSQVVNDPRWASLQPPVIPLALLAFVSENRGRISASLYEGEGSSFLIYGEGLTVMVIETREAPPRNGTRAAAWWDGAWRQ